MMDDNWQVCPYQRFFQEYAEKRQASSPVESPQTTDQFVYMKGMIHSSASSSSTTSPASSTWSSLSSAPLSTSKPDLSEDARSKYPEDQNKEDELLGRFCNEPEDLDIDYDAKNRPKLKLLTKFRGGF
jgi:hypothetical protein